MIGLTNWTQGSFFYLLSPCLLETSRNTGWMDIHEIFRIWTQEAIGYTVSRLTRLFLALYKLSVTEVCALGVLLVWPVTDETGKCRLGHKYWDVNTFLVLWSCHHIWKWRWCPHYKTHYVTFTMFARATSNVITYTHIMIFPYVVGFRQSWAITVWVAVDGDNLTIIRMHIVSVWLTHYFLGSYSTQPYSLILRLLVIQRITHELPWITIFGSQVRRFANRFEDDWQIASRVTYQSLITLTFVLFYFLHASWCLKHTITLKHLSIADFAIVAKSGLFWLNIVMSPQLICDVTRTRGTGIVASYLSIVLARANWRKGDPL